MFGNFFQDALGPLIIIPKIGRGGKLFELVNFFTTFIEVKETSRAWKVVSLNRLSALL